MLEKVSQIAQVAATNVSRREVLGRFGRAAAAAAALLAGLLPIQAEAGRPGKGRGKERCTGCAYTCPDGSSFEIYHRQAGCHKTFNGCRLTRKFDCRVGAG